MKAKLVKVALHAGYRHDVPERTSAVVLLMGREVVLEEWGWGGLPPRAAWGPDEIRHVRHLPTVPGTLSSPWLPQLAGDFFLRPPVHPVTHGCPSMAASHCLGMEVPCSARGTVPGPCLFYDSSPHGMRV